MGGGGRRGGGRGGGRRAGIASMRLDVLGRRREVWCSMRRWRCMLLAAAKQCVPPPPLVLVVVLLCVCVSVFGLCVFVCVLHVKLHVAFCGKLR